MIFPKTIEHEFIVFIVELWQMFCKQGSSFWMLISDYSQLKTIDINWLNQLTEFVPLGYICDNIHFCKWKWKILRHYV